MAKNPTAKIQVRAKQRLFFRDTETTYEQGDVIYISPETADKLLPLGLVELSGEVNKIETAKPAEETSKE